MQIDKIPACIIQIRGRNIPLIMEKQLITMRNTKPNNGKMNEAETLMAPNRLLQVVLDGISNRMQQPPPIQDTSMLRRLSVVHFPNHCETQQKQEAKKEVKSPRKQPAKRKSSEITVKGDGPITITISRSPQTPKTKNNITKKQVISAKQKIPKAKKTASKPKSSTSSVKNGSKNKANMITTTTMNVTIKTSSSSNKKRKL